jgi:toxin HigB-1
VDITFANRKLEKNFNSAALLLRAYGDRMSVAIMRRMAVLDAAVNLSQVPTTKPDRRHQLSANLKGQFAVDLIHPYRLLFEPYHDPVPENDDGGIELTQVTAITIIDVIDYH